MSINDLVEDLQTQLSDTQKERDVLEATVEALKSDIRKLGAKFPPLDPKIYNLGEQDADGPQTDNICGESRLSNGGISYHNMDDGEPVYQNRIVVEHNKTFSQQSEQEEDPTHYSLSDIDQQKGQHEDASVDEVDAAYMEQVEMIVDDSSSLLVENHVCEDCGEGFTGKRSLETHVVDVHRMDAKHLRRREVGRPRVHEDGRKMRYCAVRGCSPGRPPAVTYHRLPKKNKRKRDAWIKACGISDDERSQVCSKHFNPEDFNDSNGIRRTLRPTAIPSKKLPMELGTYHA